MHTRLEGVCSGDSPNELYLATINHSMEEPNNSSVSMLVQAELTSNGLRCTPILNAHTLDIDYTSVFNCIAKDVDGSIYIGEEEGCFVYRNGAVNIFRFRTNGTTQSAYVRGIGSVAFGLYAESIIHFESGALEKFNFPTSPSENDCIQRIHGIGADFMVAVGNDGFVARYSDGKWEKVPSPSNSLLQAVWCKSHKEIYIGGWDGCVWRWEPLSIDFDGDLNRFRFSDFSEYQGILYSANSKNGIYKLDGNKFISVPKVKK